MEEVTDEQVRAELAARQSTLLDDILQAVGIKNDAHLSRLVEMSPPVISKLRNGRMPIGPSMLIALNEISGRDIKDMKRHLGMRVLERTQPASNDMPQYHPV